MRRDQPPPPGTGRRLAGAVAAVLLLAPAGCAESAADSPPAPVATGDPPAALRVEVIDRYPHDPDAFTQGLELRDGVLYESTGRYGESDVRITDPDTGRVRHQEGLPDEVFGEGLALVDDALWQLTWKAGIAYRRDLATLEVRDQVGYEGEGWGVCYDRDADRLVMSDGTPELTFRDPRTFAPTGSVTVTRAGSLQSMINELACVAGEVWANIWLTDEIVRLDPGTGQVTAVVDAAGLLTPDEAAAADVLNGITTIPGTDTFLITGKLWPTVFLVRFVPA